MFGPYLWAKMMAALGRISNSKAAHVLLLMAEEANMDEAYTGGEQRLATFAAMPIEDVRKALQDLERDGLIRTGEYADPAGREGIELLIEKCKNGDIKVLHGDEEGCE